MTLRHFKIFIEVCNTMNMTEAAKSLYISQSAVSQAISELEKYYNIRLFERLSRRLYLTQAGEKLLGYARHMLRMSLEAENDMKQLHENSLIRIGASVTVGAHILPKLVKKCNQTYPQTEVEVFEDNTEKIEELILNDDIDMGLVEGEILSADIKKQPFMEDELVVICPVFHRFAKQSVINPNELENEKFIIREKGSGTRKLFEDVMVANHLNWRPIWTCNNADTIKMAVGEGLGISVISERAVRNEIKSGLLSQVRLDGIQFKRYFKVIYHKNKYITKSMEQFIDLFMSSVDSGLIL